MAKTGGEFLVKGFPKGVNMLSPETALPAGAVRAAINVDFDRAGKWRRRSGVTLAVTGQDVHSLWAPAGDGPDVYYVDGTWLYRVDPAKGVASRRAVRAGLTRGAPMAFCALNDEICYSNGYESGSVFDTIGMEMPVGGITCAFRAGGSLAPGAYKVGLVYVKDSGEESGALVADFHLATLGGIAVNNFPLPQDTSIRRARFYLSPPNDEDVLYQALEITFNVADILFSVPAAGKMLDTWFLTPPPPAHLLRTFNGRLYGADGSVLWYSQAFRYGLYKPSTDYIDMGARITLIEEAADGRGLFVGTTDGTFFLAGDVLKMQLQSVSELSPIEGTGTAIDTKVFGMKELPEFFAPVWFTSKGWVVGLNDGTVKNLNHDRLAVSNLERGSALVRKSNGSTHLMGVFRGGDNSAAAATDSMESEIIRNGIVIKG